jgi:recombinational DNA repair protein (RecF pathway)
VYGKSLTDLEGDSFVDARSLRDAKRVLRAALEMCLDGRELKSREVMRAMRRREAGASRLDPSPPEQP